jgi:beta-glucosidase
MAKKKRRPAKQSTKSKLGHDPFTSADLEWLKEERKRGVTRQLRLSLQALGNDPLAGLNTAALEEESLLAGPAMDEMPATSHEAEPEAPELTQTGIAAGTLLTQEPRPEATFHFPPGFTWGVATAAHQVEGSNSNSDWWAWEQEQGRIKQGKSGRACDWWENAEADFDRVAGMGLGGLRLSVDWSRIEPYPGEFDDTALERYAEMLRGLRERNVEPMITLHHFANPCWLASRGGWENPAAVEHFALFVHHVVEALGQHCDLWCTINGPNVYAALGYLEGVFPPGRLDRQAARCVTRHLLKGHAAAYREIHAVQPQGRVGLAHDMRIFEPADPRSLLDRRATRMTDRAFNDAILTALTRGRWVSPLGLGLAWKLRHTLDWIGLNYATRDAIAFDRTRRLTLYGRRLHTPDAELLDGGYGEFYPQGMLRCLRRLNLLHLPIYVTANGLPDEDDDQRPRYLLTHLHQMWHAIQFCYPVMGYYHWTLVDGFEWTEGWALRFGLLALDAETQIRTPRRSAGLYADVARANAITPQIVDTYAPELRAELLPGCRTST